LNQIRDKNIFILPVNHGDRRLSVDELNSTIDKINKGDLYGEFDFLKSFDFINNSIDDINYNTFTIIDKDNISHQILDIYCDKYGVLHTEIKILNTNSGKELRKYLNDNAECVADIRGIVNQDDQIEIITVDVNRNDV
jgi:hypothetical protein